ncbi:MAG: GntR family transcriptional regulator [Candidatus Omnitrophica bacterium]|nr:GntR family transcriptional regulator [Candidatus Omnitrophota bacterium]
MIITIDHNDPKPTYLQIVDSIRRAIATGALQPGDQLPTLREAAVQARVNRNTVSRAYLELEHLGVVRARQGAGCFVTSDGPALERKERLKIIQRMADELALEAHHYQIDIEQAIEMMRAGAAKLNIPRQSQTHHPADKEEEHV